MIQVFLFCFQYVIYFLCLFQIPNFQDEDRWFNRIIYNLMYYQTNYLIASALIFGFVLFARPQEMIMGIFLMVSFVMILDPFDICRNAEGIRTCH